MNKKVSDFPNWVLAQNTLYWYELLYQPLQTFRNKIDQFVLLWRTYFEESRKYFKVDIHHIQNASEYFSYYSQIKFAFDLIRNTIHLICLEKPKSLDCNRIEYSFLTSLGTNLYWKSNIHCFAMQNLYILLVD